MSPLRLAMAASFAGVGLLACAQIIGLDDTKDRVATDAGTDASDATAIDAGRPCNHNAECLDDAGGNAALCVQHQCVDINQDLCVGDIQPNISVLKNDNVFLIPTFLPRKVIGKDDLATLAYSLALSELSAGIPLEPHRDVAILFCASEQEKARDALNHVVKDLQLPAIIAGFGADDLTKYIRDITRPAGVFVMNPSVTPEDLKYDNDPKQLFWSLLGTTEEVALTYRPLVEKAFAYLHNTRDRKLKVALVYTNTPGEKGAATQIQFGSYVEGQTTADAGSRNLNAAIVLNDGLTPNADKDNFKAIQFEGSEQDTATKLPAELVTNIVKFNPDIIIALTAGEIVPLVKEVDQAMKTQLPMWLLGQRNNNWPELLTYLTAVDPKTSTGESSDTRTKRFIGVQFAASLEKDQHDAWLERMDRVYRDKTAIDYSTAENFYDAVYWLAYGLYVGRQLHSDTTDSEAIRDGVRRLLTGPPIYPAVGLRAFDDFRDPKLKDIDHTYVGALGHPDIDPRFGTWRSVGSTYCYPIADKVDGGYVVTPRYDIQRYDPDSGTLFDVPNATKCHVF